jgi:hypothetical protein
MSSERSQNDQSRPTPRAPACQREPIAIDAAEETALMSPFRPECSQGMGRATQASFRRNREVTGQAGAPSCDLLLR